MRGDYFDTMDWSDVTLVPGSATFTGIRSDGGEVVVPFEYEARYAMCWRCGEEWTLHPVGTCDACDHCRQRKLCWGCIIDDDADDAFWWHQNTVPPSRLHALTPSTNDRLGPGPDAQAGNARRPPPADWGVDFPPPTLYY